MGNEIHRAHITTDDSICHSVMCACMENPIDFISSLLYDTIHTNLNTNIYHENVIVEIPILLYSIPLLPLFYSPKFTQQVRYTIQNI